MIKFQVSISIPGCLGVEDELSNLLQGEGEEKELKYAVKEAIWSWFACWMPYMPLSKIRIRIEQE